MLNSRHVPLLCFSLLLSHLISLARQLLAESISLDKKIRYSIGPKASVALKYLRKQLAGTLATHLSGKPVVGSEAVWEDIAMAILGKLKPEDTEKKAEKLKLVVNKKL
jgi:hypothetical protein